MAARTKVVVKKTIGGNKDIAAIADEVFGGNGDVPVEIGYPKFRQVEHHLERFAAIVEVLGRAEELDQGHRLSLGQYAGTVRAEVQGIFKGVADFARDYPLPNLMGEGDAPPDAGWSDPRVDYAAIPEGAVAGFQPAFARMRASGVIADVVNTCSRLTQYKASLSDRSALRAGFLTRTSAGTFMPLAGLPDFNFKAVFQRQPPKAREYLLLILHKMYTISHDVYEAMSRPDIDVDAFVEIVESSLGDVQKHIPRCQDAFNIIKSSVGMLKDNFSGYYRGFMGSNNPTIIVESFIGDVAANSNASPKVMSQFKRIVGHYQRLTRESGNDPRLQGALNVVTRAFGSMDSGGAAGDDDADAPDEGEGHEGEGPGPAADSSTVLERSGVDTSAMTEEERKKAAQRERRKARERRRAADDRYERSLADVFREEDEGQDED